MQKIVQTALAELKKKGRRVTLARKAVIEALASAAAPLSAREVLGALSARRAAPDRATVYRELESLAADGIAAAVRFEARAVRFELAGGTHHHHAVCVKCDSVADVEADAALEAAERRIARRSGFKVLRHSFELFGLCADCR